MSAQEVGNCNEMHICFSLHNKRSKCQCCDLKTWGSSQEVD